MTIQLLIVPPTGAAGSNVWSSLDFPFVLLLFFLALIFRDFRFMYSPLSPFFIDKAGSYAFLFLGDYI